MSLMVTGIQKKILKWINTSASTIIRKSDYRRRHAHTHTNTRIHIQMREVAIHIKRNFSSNNIYLLQTLLRDTWPKLTLKAIIACNNRLSYMLHCLQDENVEERGDLGKGKMKMMRKYIAPILFIFLLAILLLALYNINIIMVTLL